MVAYKDFQQKLMAFVYHTFMTGKIMQKRFDLIYFAKLMNTIVSANMYFKALTLIKKLKNDFIKEKVISTVS